MKVVVELKLVEVLNFKNMEKKDKFLMIMVGGLIIAVLFLSWRIGILKNSSKDALDDMKKSIIATDKLTKEKDGQYAKLVDYYKSEKDLKKELKASNEELYKTIKKQGERILSLTSAVVSLQGAVSEGFGHTDPVDSNLINLTLKYPEDKNPFITWGGSINKNTSHYKGEWTFGKLPLQIVLTEEKRGLWKTRLIGPDWFKCDSLMVNSLPAEQYTENKARKLQFLVGGGYNKSLSPTGADAVSVGGGINVFDKHNIILNVNTNKEIGINYYYKFQSFKKRK
jgi:hypothetical protein